MPYKSYQDKLANNRKTGRTYRAKKRERILHALSCMPRVCARCEISKTFDDFGPAPGRIDQTSTVCLECKRGNGRRAQATYRRVHKDALAIERRSASEEKKEAIRATVRRRRIRNPEKVRAKGRHDAAVLRQRDPERVRATGRRSGKKRRAERPDQERARQQAKKAKNPALYQAIAQAAKARRRSRLLQAPVNDLTAKQWVEIQEVFDHRCAYCGKRAKGRLTQDHITPLSKGGPNTASNVVPACRSCNSKKLAGPPLRAVQPLLLTSVPAKKKVG